MPERQPRGPNCFGCRHFEVRHEPAWPYACRHFDFRSRALPSLEVLRASGSPCAAWQPLQPLRRRALPPRDRSS